MNYRIVFFLLLFLSGCNSSKTTSQEPLFQEQWALHYDQPFYDAYAINKEAHIHATNAMQHYTAKGVKVAIIDIGFDVEHFEYKKNIVKVINSADGSTNVACYNSQQCYHGTAIAGVLAANVNGKGLRGIAPDVELVLIKLDLAGYIGDDEILNALEYAQKENVDIINNSWGTGDVSFVVQEKINQMAQEGRDGKGIVFIFASGNEGKENGNDESMLESVIGVGATDEENLRAIYSNFGEGLDVMAPGGFNLGITTTQDTTQEDITSLYKRAEDYDKFQGTSAAAPLVTGAVALLLQKYPNLTVQEIQNILHNSSDKIGNVPYENGRNKYYGYGKINVDSMLKYQK